jgi:histidinol-phosphate aminotransferase
MYSPKPKIEHIIRPAHGGIDRAELRRFRVDPEKVLDFSVSVNPFGPPPGMREAIAQAAVDIYPDSDSSEVRELLAAKLHVAPENIFVGSGSTEIIRLIGTAFFDADDRVVIPQPTYGEYETACQLVGARLLKPWMLGEVDFRLNLKRLKELIDEYRPSGLFLCNPNNPTGEYLARDIVNNLRYTLGRGVFILDEAYVAFTETPWNSLELIDTDHLIVVRSMTKDFALPGLRLGYAVSSKSFIALLDRVKPPWNVSSIAQAAAKFVLGQDDYLADCALKLREARGFLVNGLRQLGFAVIPSDANFFLVKVGDAAGFREALLHQGIIVRNCASFGMPTYIRLAPRSLEDCRKLLTAIDTAEVRRHAS